MADQALASDLHQRLLHWSRQPAFYGDHIADTLSGRFDVLSLHAVLVLAQLERRPRLYKRLFHLMIRDIDAALREQSVGDVGVYHRLRKVTKAFHARLYYYISAGGKNMTDAAMASWLRQHFLGEVKHGDAFLAHLIVYMRKVQQQLSERPITSWPELAFTFPDDVLAV